MPPSFQGSDTIAEEGGESMVGEDHEETVFSGHIRTTVLTNSQELWWLP